MYSVKSAFKRHFSQWNHRRVYGLEFNIHIYSICEKCGASVFIQKPLDVYVKWALSLSCSAALLLLPSSSHSRSIRAISILASLRCSISFSLAFASLSFSAAVPPAELFCSINLSTVFSTVLFLFHVIDFIMMMLNSMKMKKTSKIDIFHRFYTQTNKHTRTMWLNKSKFFRNSVWCCMHQI